MLEREVTVKMANSTRSGNLRVSDSTPGSVGMRPTSHQPKMGN